MRGGLQLRERRDDVRNLRRIEGICWDLRDGVNTNMNVSSQVRSGKVKEASGMKEERWRHTSCRNYCTP